MIKSSEAKQQIETMRNEIRTRQEPIEAIKRDVVLSESAIKPGDVIFNELQTQHGYWFVLEVNIGDDLKWNGAEHRLVCRNILDTGSHGKRKNTFRAADVRRAGEYDEWRKTNGTRQ